MSSENRNEKTNIIKRRVTAFINQLLTEYSMTQSSLASALGISQERLSSYAAGRDLPKADVLIGLAELTGLTLDQLLRSEAPPQPREISIDLSGGKVTGGVVGVVQGDVYQNTRPRRVYPYTYEPGDLTDEQAANLQQLVGDIVSLESTVKRKPTTHASVWSALRRKFKVPYYRKIGEQNFDLAAQYLRMWKGRLTRPLARKDPEAFRRARYGSIFGTARKHLGWTKDDLHGYVFNEYNVQSLTELTDKQLDQLYSRIMSMKRRY
jgi:predicted XRE-type DNA-binding protein